MCTYSCIHTLTLKYIYIYIYIYIHPLYVRTYIYTSMNARMRKIFTSKNKVKVCDLKV
jgi:hypothetical protein